MQAHIGLLFLVSLCRSILAQSNILFSVLISKLSSFIGKAFSFPPLARSPVSSSWSYIDFRLCKFRSNGACLHHSPFPWWVWPGSFLTGLAHSFLLQWNHPSPLQVFLTRLAHSALPSAKQRWPTSRLLYGAILFCSARIGFRCPLLRLPSRTHFFHLQCVCSNCVIHKWSSVVTVFILLLYRLKKP